MWLRSSSWPLSLVDHFCQRGISHDTRAPNMSEALALPSYGCVPHQGMPPIDSSGPALSFFEFWPQKLFYAPMILYWLWLTLKHGGRFALPTAANPTFPMGGWIGESKEAVLSNAGDYACKFISPCISFVHQRQVPLDHIVRAAAHQAQAAGFTFPLVAKPDKGCRGAGVRRVHNQSELAGYVAQFPAGERIVLQALVDHEAEAGVFYIRRPGETRGQIFSLTLKYFPYVYGDGSSTLGELIARDQRAGKLKVIYLPRHAGRQNQVLAPGQPYRIAFAGSHSRGTIFRDGNRYVTEPMRHAFDCIAKDIDGFHFGRFDVRFSSIEELQQGRNFIILECNGAGAEATHIWDRKTSLRTAYRVLMDQYKTLWEIGAENVRRGARPARLIDLFRAWRNEVDLWSQYPLTE
jgi:hypothetical protein